MPAIGAAMVNTNSSLSALEYHVLLALVSGPSHGYAIRDAVAAESAGTLDPRAASLYRVIARLISSGLVEEAEAPPDEPPHPGLPRRYYALLPAGRAAVSGETRRLAGVAELARERLRMGDA